MAGTLKNRAYILTLTDYLLFGVPVAIFPAGASPILVIPPEKGPRVSFSVSRSLEKDPNTASISVYNLSESTRSELAKRELDVELMAGYVDTCDTIFTGSVRTVRHQHAGTNWITTIEAGDGDRFFKQADLDLSLPIGTPTTAAVDAMTPSIPRGIDFGMGITKIKALLADPESAMFKVVQWIKGGSFVGKLHEEVDKIVKSSNASWSIQNGSLQVLKEKVAGKPAKEISLDEPIFLSPSSGLIESVSGGVDSNGDPIINCTSLLQPGLHPGRCVLLSSAAYPGFQKTRIESVKHRGDTHGQQWISELELAVI